ncbi:MAG: hypothetical protein FJX62_00770 [Alphaproteobacteria bacterium]|nr:hypothetical protein [Alphaproteobacteria bacterium]
MGAEVKAKVDLNKFYDQASKDIGGLIQGAAVNGAVIYNNTDKNVTFDVYNYIDSVNWIPAQKTLVAPGFYGTVVASGKFFKVHPNNNKNEEFLVAPHKAYVYDGPGKLQTV